MARPPLPPFGSDCADASVAPAGERAAVRATPRHPGRECPRTTNFIDPSASAPGELHRQHPGHSPDYWPPHHHMARLTARELNGKEGPAAQLAGLNVSVRQRIIPIPAAVLVFQKPTKGVSIMETFFDLMSAEIDETLGKAIIWTGGPVLGYLLYVLFT